MLRTFDFNLAELLATKAVQDYKKLNLDKIPDLFKYLGMLYAQLSEANMGKGNFRQAENYFKLSYEWNFKAGKYVRVRQTLTNEAYGLYYKDIRIIQEPSADLSEH